MSRLFMFDAYGTLFDVLNLVKDHALPHYKDRADEIGKIWRRKQLEYTWTYSSMRLASDVTRDFEHLTARALDYTLAEGNIADPPWRDILLNAYFTPKAYPDVAPALQDIQTLGYKTAIFTNGTRKMVNAAVAAAGIDGLIDKIVTVEGTGRYKPHPDVYAHALAQFPGTKAHEVVFISTNRWDIAGAANAGFTPVWCNRLGMPNEYQGLDAINMVYDLNGIGGV